MFYYIHQLVTNLVRHSLVGLSFNLLIETICQLLLEVRKG